MYYTYYNGTDEYSNGDIEDELLNIVKNNKEYDKTINETDSFAVFYHLSKNREFITGTEDSQFSQRSGSQAYNRSYGYK